MWPYFKFVTCTEYSQSDFSSKISSSFFFYLSSGRVGGGVGFFECLFAHMETELFKKTHGADGIIFQEDFSHAR